MSEDIAEMVDSCETCQKFRSSQQTESLKPHEAPSHPWERLGTDFFSYQDKHYLLVVDHYSSYPEVMSIPTPSSFQAVFKMKSIFARHGIPSDVRADNQPFNSQDFRDFESLWTLD